MYNVYLMYIYKDSVFPVFATRVIRVNYGIKMLLLMIRERHKSQFVWIDPHPQPFPPQRYKLMPTFHGVDSRRAWYRVGPVKDTIRGPWNAAAEHATHWTTTHHAPCPEGGQMVWHRHGVPDAAAVAAVAVYIAAGTPNITVRTCRAAAVVVVAGDVYADVAVVVVAVDVNADVAYVVPRFLEAVVVVVAAVTTDVHSWIEGGV